MDEQRVAFPGQNPDRDVFLRVWQRVMPEEREGCPVTVERPQSDNAQKMQSTADAAGDDFPGPEDVPCLGCGGEADQECLQDMIQQELACWHAYQMLVRRGGQGSRVLAALASGSRRKAKRLSAALFLISGLRFWPAEPTATPVPRSYFGALRELFYGEQNRCAAYRAAAEESRDRCLCALYLDLADESMEHACRIRTLLENT